MSESNLAANGEGKNWSKFFYAAALFNFVIGLAGMVVPQSTLDGRIIGLLVFAFGIIYLLVARAPKLFAPTLWAGLVGKLGIVGLLGPQTFSADGEPIMMAVLGLDLTFALGFLYYLFNRKEA